MTDGNFSKTTSHTVISSIRVNKAAVKQQNNSRGACMSDLKKKMDEDKKGKWFLEFLESRNRNSVQEMTEMYLCYI